VELRERLAGGNAPTTTIEHQAPAPVDASFVELKDRIHMAVISELGPRLYN
jgi:hypothetical protein